VTPLTKVDSNLLEKQRDIAMEETCSPFERPLTSVLAVLETPSFVKEDHDPL
jgi:hypothetical protein